MKEESKEEKNGLLKRIGGWRGVGFYALIAAFVGLIGALLGPFLTFIIVGWSGATGPHHLHDMAFVGMIWAALVGMVAQAYRPAKRVGAMQQAVLVITLVIASMVLAGNFFPPALVVVGLAVAATLLHPAGRDVFRVHTTGRFSPVLAGLALVAAVPLAVYAIDQLALQGVGIGMHAHGGDEHALAGHYASMAMYAVIVVALGLLASAKPTGWLIPLLSAAGLAAILGIASVLFPAQASSVGPTWGAAALGWAVAFAATGIASTRRNPAKRSRTEEAPSVTGESTPRSR